MVCVFQWLSTLFENHAQNPDAAVAQIVPLFAALPS